MRRPGIDGRHQHQAPQAGVGWPNKVSFRTDSCHHDGDATAVGSTQKVGSFTPSAEIFDSQGASVGVVPAASASGHAASTVTIKFPSSGNFSVMVSGPLDGSSGL